MEIHLHHAQSLGDSSWMDAHAISRIGLPVETFGGEKRKRGKASQVVRM